LLPTTIATLYSQAAKGLSKAGNQAGNRPYSTQLLSQQVTSSQSSQFGPELGNSDRFGNDFILATQY
jgi:hypothetical protein